MKTLFRVAKEDDIKTGMYSCSQDVSWSMSGDSQRHPMPYEDNKLCDFWSEFGSCDFYFGFSTKEQLTFWVYLQSVREELENENFVVYEIYVNEEDEDSEWKAGDTQAVFHIDCLTVVTKWKLSEFFGEKYSEPEPPKIQPYQERFMEALKNFDMNEGDWKRMLTTFGTARGYSKTSLSRRYPTTFSEMYGANPKMIISDEATYIKRWDLGQTPADEKGSSRDGPKGTYWNQPIPEKGPETKPSDAKRAKLRAKRKKRK